MAEVEIYGLYDPDTGELRYIGKANNSVKRLKTHIWESSMGKRPVCLWIKSLLNQSKYPNIEILERIPPDQWKVAERKWIAKYRPTLLNLAPGGDMPYPTREQRQSAAKAANESQARNPKLLAFNQAKRNVGKLYARLSKTPDIHAYTLRLLMKCHTVANPELHKCWINLP